MPVTIQVYYPEADGTDFTEADIAALRGLEPTILQRAVALLNSTSSYRWERDPAVADGSYARLVKRSDSREILSQPLAYLRRITAEEFETLLVKRAFELAQEDKNQPPSA